MTMTINESELLKSAKKMQDEMKSLREKMGAYITIGDSKDGVVHIKINGNHQIKDVSMTGIELPDKSKICADIVEAFNFAITEADIELEKRMSTITNKYVSETIQKTGFEDV